MKSVLTIAAAALMAVVTAASAQGNSKPPGSEPDKQAMTAQPNPSDPEAAQNQPWMATGVDLNGPPQRFSSKETPE